MPESAAPPSDAPRHRWTLLGAAVAPLVAAWFVIGSPIEGWPLDDAWIHMQLARNLAAGEGLALRPPALAVISTAPLWTALMAVGFAAPGLVGLWGKSLGVACLAAALPAVVRLAGRLGLPPAWGGFAAVLAGVAGWSVWGALSGLEIPLFVCLSAWGLERFAAERTEGRLPLSLVLLALAGLARPEGGLLLVLAVGALLPAARQAAGRRSLLLGLAAAAIVLAPTLLFQWVAGGSLAPQTLDAKTDGFRGPLPDASYLLSSWSVLGRSGWLAALLAPVGAVLAVVGAVRGRARRASLAAVWFLALPLALSTVEPASGRLLGNFGRYLFPLLPWVGLFALVALYPLARTLRRALSIAHRPAVALVALALLGTTLAATVDARRLYRSAVGNVQSGDVAVARWLGERLDPRALVAVHDLGAFAYHLPNPLLDLAGIASPEVRPALRSERWQRELGALLAERRPDYLAVFPRYLPFVERDERFVEVHATVIEGNVALAADRIAVLASPWNRFPLRASDGEGRDPEKP